MPKTRVLGTKTVKIMLKRTEGKADEKNQKRY